MSSVLERIRLNVSGSERRVSVIGMPKVGKTTMLGLLWLACATRANTDKSFYARIEEKTSGIREVPNRMREGFFPLPTNIGQIYDADFIIKKKSRFGTQSFRLPFVDTAGEDLSKLISAISNGSKKIDQHSRHLAWQLYEYVLQSIGFILLAPCDMVVSSTRPDLEIVRLLESIIAYKEWTHSPPIEGLALIFSKADLVSSQLKSEGIDLSHQNEALRIDSTRRFMEKYLPDTYSAISFYDTRKTIFLPSWVDLQYNPDGSAVLNNEDGSPRIKVDHRTRLPFFSRYYYNHLINWLYDTFSS